MSSCVCVWGTPDLTPRPTSSQTRPSGGVTSSSQCLFNRTWILIRPHLRPFLRQDHDGRRKGRIPARPTPLTPRKLQGPAREAVWRVRSRGAVVTQSSVHVSKVVSSSRARPHGPTPELRGRTVTEGRSPGQGEDPNTVWSDS